ncbi:GRAS family protein RAD1-like [Humulus lupulus]|uniref:GRAS family protein RAD1-like n=1 Tax=Humulus lupulus TaxID=3486 RepID=UPI002B40B697|nr:GRAS family protein RAD1-like [Humulus lupulus]
MEALNIEYSSLNHDLAIRRFCPARFEEERGEWEEILNEIEMCSPTETTGTTPLLEAWEIDEFVDSFINMEHYDDKESPGDDQGGLEMFSIANDGVCDMEISGSPGEDDVVSRGLVMPSVEEASHGVDQGLHLVHMLLACAEAVGCRDTQLADSMLNQIWASVTPFGDSLQRVSYCFATGLKSRLSFLHNNVNTNGTFMNGAAASMEVSLVSMEEKMEAFQLLYQTTPFIAFGCMVANEAICQAATGKDYLHIIDLGMEHTLQWPSLIRTLASRPEGSPKQLRITGLIDDDQSLVAELETSMNALVEEASSLGVPLKFSLISEPVTPSLFNKEKLNLREEETLFFNGFMHLHKYVKESRGSLKAILQALKKLSPALFTVVEQDANHNGPFFLGRFLESLHYYSAIFDSLEASLPRNSQQRMKIERHHFAEEIRNIVAFEGSSRIERHERVDQWRRQLGRAGFQVLGLKCLSQARMMLSVYGCDGYTLASEKGCLLLGWKGRPILLASAWQVNNVPSS